MRITIILAITLAACEGAAPPYQYNTASPVVSEALDAAITLINDAGGCELVEVGNDEGNSTTLSEVPEHSHGANSLACATRGSAHGSELPDIVLSSAALDDDRLVSIVTHEVLHTLGLGHLAEDDRGIMSAVAGPSDFSASTVEILRDLCFYHNTAF